VFGSKISHVSFLGELDFSLLLSLGHHVLILNSHKTTSPLFLVVGVLVELGEEVLLQGIEVLEIFLSDLGEGDASGSLGVDELTESGLSLDEAIWDTLLSAESWEEDHHLEWVDIMGDHNELGLVFLDEGGDVVETELEEDWLWTDEVLFLSALSGFSFSLESGLLVLDGLWGILGQELEELGSLVLVNSLGELVESWWGLQSHEEDSLLSLDSDILWPFDESGKISLWLDITTDSEVSSGLLEKGVGSSSCFTSSTGGDDLLFTCDFLWHCVFYFFND
jgi:hypothetical protein